MDNRGVEERGGGERCRKGWKKGTWGKRTSVTDG